MGSRDSELAVIVEDSEKVNIKMAGKSFQASKFAHEFRVKCFKSIFGFSSDYELQDPCDSMVWEKISKRAKVRYSLTDS